MSTITFRTTTGSVHTFEPFPPHTTWHAVGGVYMFGRPTAGRPGVWDVFYIGRTDNFQRRFSNHERWPEAVARGVTHVLATVVNTEAAREQLERELIVAAQPPMNDQHKRSAW